MKIVQTKEEAASEAFQRIKDWKQCLRCQNCGALLEINANDFYGVDTVTYGYFLCLECNSSQQVVLSTELYNHVLALKGFKSIKLSWKLFGRRKE